MVDRYTRNYILYQVLISSMKTTIKLFLKKKNILTKELLTRPHMKAVSCRMYWVKK